MILKKKLEKIDIEIENGLRNKASDRLRNLIQENPNNIQLWNKLAELYYQSGFLDAAGKYWILTEPIDDRIKKCVDIYEKSVNYSGYKILQDITFRGEKSKLSLFAQNKLAELESDSKEKINHIPKFKPRVNKQKKKKQRFNETGKGRFVIIMIIGILILIVILVLIGIGTVINSML